MGDVIEPVEDVADDEAEDDAESTLVEDGDEEPLLEDLAARGLCDDVESKEEEGEGYTIIHAALRAQQVPDALGHARAELAVGQHRGSEHRVGGCQAGGNSQRRGKIRIEEQADEKAAYQPSKAHHRTKKNKQSLPLLLQIAIGKFQTDSEALDAYYDARELLDDRVLEAPFVRRQPAQALGAGSNAKERGQRRFREMQTVPDHDGEERIHEQERGQHQVRQVRPCGLELRPHGDGVGAV